MNAETPNSRRQFLKAGAAVSYTHLDVYKRQWLTGLALMLGIGLVVGALPAMRAMRLKIVDALAGR